ncbi:hypothetical protein TH25_25320 [Thalassospira profundimaris]|uniref:Uncharacterized protein n=1 Tax=Thalassospira profundimaris TaxID=502049 RepID=A0A367WD37_9PROT|nr:hypothetical protein TH25_25320 [Thalassospira profundimaris]
MTGKLSMSGLIVCEKNPSRQQRGKRMIQLSQAVAKYNYQGLTYSKLFSAINQGALRLYRRRLDAENLLSYFHLDEAQLSKWYLGPS